MFTISKGEAQVAEEARQRGRLQQVGRSLRPPHGRPAPTALAAERLQPGRHHAAMAN